MKYKLFTDGGARGNPGPAAAGVVLKDDGGKVVKEMGMYLGICTNNEAEYRALILGLKMALKQEVSELECFLDSELVVKQLNGKYKVKNPNLKVFFDSVKKLEFEFSDVTYKHVFRTNNKEADSVVNQVLDAQKNE